MKYSQIQTLDEEKFRRLTGIKRKTFFKMIQILQEEEKKENKRKREK